MAARDHDDERLRTVALENAQVILRARLEAELALKQQSEWLRVTLASIGDAVISTDALGRVIFLNAVAEALTGWPLSEAKGRDLPDVFNIINEQTRQTAENPALRALREGTIVGLANHTVLIARDGTERPIDDSTAPIRDDSGTLSGAVLVFRDVTDRRRADEALARLAAIVQFSDDAIVSKTLEGVITSWNHGAERLFGYTALEAVGRPITLIIPAERLHEERMILERIRRGESVEHFETVRVTKSGRQVDISVTVSPLRDSHGNLIGASKIARDISEQKRADAALREQERLLRQVADAALSIHSAGSLDSVQRVIAEEARRILGARRAVSSVTARSDSSQAITAVSSSPPDEGPRDQPIPPGLAQICAEVCRTNRPMRLTRADLDAHPALRKMGDGNRPLGPERSWLAVPLVSRGGRNLGLIHVSDKIAALEDSDFSESEAVVLAQLAHVASVAIENARLYGELREQDRRKDEFLALLAHELRNPLAPLRNGLQVMRLAKGDADAVHEARAMMERQLAHMVRLIDDLLDISRITCNKMELRRARIWLADVVSHALDGARPAIEAGAHQLSISLPAEPVALDADLTRLAQVFANLLTNSAKYTEPGGRISLSASQTGGQAVVSVHDTGIGIPPEDLPRIFDMFSQLDRNIERATGGLGIGLALVKGLVEMHGGSVSAESAGDGKGSTFTVRLPAQKTAPQAPSAASSDVDPVGSSPPRRILVVDDNRDSAASMASLLTLLGNHVRTAHDGIEAVNAAEEFRPEVILMDVGMPRLGGYEATRCIRARPWGRSVNIIALTGWGQEIDRIQSREFGCNGHLVKPVDIAELKQLLTSMASEQDSSTASRQP